MVVQESRGYYTLEIEPWDEQRAWGDAIDEEEASGEKAPKRRVRKEDQEEVFDWGDA